MSRCFPYPPSGYYAKGERNEALIESSIKLQREREKAKAERKKERKREKKEKKRESKVKDVSELDHDGKRKRKRKDAKAQHWDKETVHLEAKGIQKRNKDESEQLEKSNLTEEHEQPICLQNPCYSDSTENSNKRRRQTSPVNDILRTHGNVLRIRLPSLKLKEPDSSVKEALLCSSSKPIQEDKEQLCSTSGQGNLWTSRESTSKNMIPTVESLFKDLVENWVSPAIQTERTDDDELEWLFERKHANRESSNAASSRVLCTGSSNLWPRAQFLPEADTYVLPFTVPF